MDRDDRLPFRDLRDLRRTVEKLYRAGRILYNLRAIKSKGHVEVRKGIIDAVLLHGTYRFDKDNRDRRDRFNALGQYGHRDFKVVFEVHARDDGEVVMVVTAYEVD